MTRWGWSLLVFIVGCGGGTPDPGITDDDRSTWVRGCKAVITTPVGTHPANCELRPSCLANGMGHRGGHRRHDWCADTQPPNRFWRKDEGLPAGTGCDVQIGDRRSGPFPDAATSDADNSVWEVKVDDYTCYPQFLKDKRWKDALQSFCNQAAVIENCGYKFVFGIADDEMYRRIIDTFMTDPDFKGMPAVENADFTNLQACRPSSAFQNEPDSDAGDCQAGEDPP